MSKDSSGNAPEFLKESDGFTDITLAKPITIDGAKMATLRMREPLVRDIEASQDSKENAASTEVNLFANLCMLKPEDIRALSVRNYFRLQAAYSRFMN